GTESLALTFECTGAPTCTGTYRSTYRYIGCSSPFVLTDKIVITNIGFTPGPLHGTVTLTKIAPDFDDLGGVMCVLNSTDDFVSPYTGYYNGTTGGTFSVPPFNGTFALSHVAPPIFGMT